MFQWTGMLDRAAYARRLAAALSYLVAITVGFGLVVWGIEEASGCKGVGGCEAVGLSASLTLKPVLFYLFLAIIANFCIRRARDIGAPGWTGLFIPLMFFGSYPFTMAVAPHQGHGFPPAILSMPFLWYLLFGLACAALLGLAQKDALRGGMNAGLKWAILIMGGTIATSATGLGLGTLLVGVPSIVTAVLFLVHSAPFAMPVFFGACVLALVKAMRGEGSVETSKINTTEVPWKLWRPIAVALMTALLCACLASGQAAVSGLWIFPLFVIPLLIPTFAVYFFPIAAAFRFGQTRRKLWIVLFLVSLTPFAGWGANAWMAREPRLRELDDIARIQTVPLRARTSSVMLEGGDLDTVRCVRRQMLSSETGIDEVLIPGPKVGSFERYTRATAYALSHTGEVLEQPPKAYLAVALGASRYAPPRKLLDPAAPPFEVYSVVADSRNLAAVSYTTMRSHLSVPPVLSILGWYRQEPTVRVNDCRSTVDIVAALIASAPSLAEPAHY